MRTAMTSLTSCCCCSSCCYCSCCCCRSERACESLKTEEIKSKVGTREKSGWNWNLNAGSEKRNESLRRQTSKQPDWQTPDKTTVWCWKRFDHPPSKPCSPFPWEKKSLINGHKESEFDVRPKGNGLESKGRKGFKSRIREGTQLEANSNPHVCCRGRDVRPDPQGEKKRKKSGQKERK